ncbi:hypothetical protein Trco_006924 [Trichoderma cornu-damae]|uniref:Uncharacterized protein n=1 Tax=Trichoderma cornu-damae TaxID=654480 RepID=A0A9P8QMS1_9HYPO|nr:hypothetical protein Trco_006924 [Trichoderma cornu-damae]
MVTPLKGRYTVISASHEERRRAGICEDAAGSDEEAGSNGASQGQKLQVTALEATLELLAIVGKGEVGNVIGRAGLDVDRLSNSPKEQIPDAVGAYAWPLGGLVRCGRRKVTGH